MNRNKTTLNRTGNLKKNSSLQNTTKLQKPQECPMQSTQELGYTGLSRGKVTLMTHAKSGSTREIGDVAESQMKHEIDKSLRIEDTRNSGALFYDGDFKICLSDTSGDYLRCEGKFRNSSGFTVSKKHWNDIKEKANKHGGIPALITQNKEKEVLVTMSLKQLSHMVSRNV
jgi:hypothetical protein